MAGPMRSLIACALVYICLIAAVHAVGDHAPSRPLTSFSFKPPFFPEAGSVAVPGWEVRGATVVHEEYIRLTPDELNKSGYITNRRPFFMNTMELTMAFSVRSDTPNGADGMALWLTDQPVKPGSCFGAADPDARAESWNGLAVFLDTYDNNGNQDNPRISVHRNDGTFAFDFATDGTTTELGGCTADFHNQDISYLHLFYDDGRLQLFVDPNGGGDWQSCMEPQYIELPKRFFFGVSAATGGFSDFHDVISLNVNTMDAKFANNPHGVEDTMVRPPVELQNPERAAELAAAKEDVPEVPVVLLQDEEKEKEEEKDAAAPAAKSPPSLFASAAGGINLADKERELEAEHKRLDELESRLEQEQQELEQEKAQLVAALAKAKSAGEDCAPQAAAEPAFTLDDVRALLTPMVDNVNAKAASTASQIAQLNNKLDSVKAQVDGAGSGAGAGAGAAADSASKAQVDSMQQYLVSVKKELQMDINTVHETLDMVSSRLGLLEDEDDDSGGDRLSKDFASLQSSMAQIQRTLSQMQIEQRKLRDATEGKQSQQPPQANARNSGYQNNYRIQDAGSMDLVLPLAIGGGLIGVLVLAVIVYCVCKPKAKTNPRLF